MIRLVALFGLLAGCKNDPVRDLVEKDTSGSALAIAACVDAKRNLPADACKRVALRAADNVVAAQSATRLQCSDALEIADLLARERLPVIAAKCCRMELATESEVICKRVAPEIRPTGDSDNPEAHSAGVRRCVLLKQDADKEKCAGYARSFAADLVRWGNPTAFDCRVAMMAQRRFLGAVVRELSGLCCPTLKGDDALDDDKKPLCEVKK